MKNLALACLATIVTAASALAGSAVVRTEEILNLDGSAGKPIYTQAWTPPNPKGLVVYTHGFTDNSRNHRRLYELLNSKGYAVAAWDMIGHGTSFGLRAFVDDFDDFIRALDMVRVRALERVPAGTPVYVAGYSMGGLVTLRYAQVHDADISGSFYFSPLLKMHLSWMRRMLNHFSKPLDRLLPHVVTPTGVIVPMLLTDPEVLAEREKDPYFFEVMTVHLFRQLLAGMDAVARDATKLTKPLLLQAAGQELIVELSATNDFYARIPAAAHKQFQLWPQLRHELDNETGRVGVYEVLGRWLDEQSQKRAFRQLHAK